MLKICNLISLPFIPNKIVAVKTKKLSIDEKELDRCINYITTEECTFSSTLNNILDGMELKVGDHVIYKNFKCRIHSIYLHHDSTKEYIFQKVDKIL